MTTQKVLDLCSGIGGFALAGAIAGGFETVAFCDIDSYCQQILALRFPGIPVFKNIKDVTTQSLQSLGIQHVDGICASLPCQPFSHAGNQKAEGDDRNLFPEFFRILREVRPQWAIIENVSNLRTVKRGEFFHSILWGFAEVGFDAEWGIVSAASVGAVHLRERMWIVATDSNGNRCRCGADNRTERHIHNDQERNSTPSLSNGKQLFFESGEICETVADSNGNRRNERGKLEDSRKDVAPGKERTSRTRTERICRASSRLSEDKTRNNAANSQSERSHEQVLLESNSFRTSGQTRQAPRELGTANSQSPGRRTPRSKKLQEGTNQTPISSSDRLADSRIEGLENGKCRTSEQGEIFESERCGCSTNLEQVFEPEFCGSDDGFPPRLDGYLLRQDGLEDWMCAATIPSFPRLSAEEVATLSPKERSEYQEAWKEYQKIRKEHKARLKALGNAIVPQCAAIPLLRLKEKLSLF